MIHIPRPAPEEDTKYIVFKTELLELFRKCPFCTADTEGVISKVTGTAIHVQQRCHSCHRVRHWDSQPFIGRMPAGNLLLSGAILFSGSLIAKVLRLFKLMKLQCYGRTAYFRHQTDYVQPTVVNGWKEHQSELMDVVRLEVGPITVAGDARSDSPGHCAKYGSFSILEQHLNKVLDIQMVQVRCFICFYLFYHRDSYCYADSLFEISITNCPCSATILYF